MQVKLLGIINVGFEVTDQLLIRFLYLSDIGEKMGVLWDTTSAIHKLQEAFDTVRREVLCSILEFGVPMKLVRLIEICLNETYSNAHKMI
jgi:hypothetical protein